MGSVKNIYKRVPEELHMGGIMQILAKLAREWKIEMNTNTGRWRMKDRPPKRGRSEQS